VLIDRGMYKTVLVKPTDNDLDRALANTGYLVLK
jgi:hypothetical protein